MRSGGFLVGAVGGLAMALLLVGAVSLAPHSGPSTLAAQSTQTSSASAQYAAAPATGYLGAAAVSSSSTTSEFVPAAASSSHAQQGPDALASLSGERAGGLIELVSPLVLGLLVAALVYGVYTRRQDASS